VERFSYMKISTRHMCWISMLMCSSLLAQSPAYTVKAGDSLARIARKHSCTPQELAAANGMKLNAVIHPGQSLKLPAKAGPASESVTTSSTAASAETTVAPPGGSHTIKPGETLSSVSRRYKVSLSSILAANPGIKPNTLKVGQKIQLGAVEAPKPEVAAIAEPTTPPASEAKAPLPVKEEAVAEAPPAEPEAKIRSVLVDREITYGEFAAKHATDVVRLNDLNGLDLNNSTVLAKGSELYVQANP
jgi:LysM repeat protein